MPRPRIDLPMDQIVPRYKGGESANSLGEEFGTSASTIINRLQELEIETRSRGKAEELQLKNSVTVYFTDEQTLKIRAIVKGGSVSEWLRQLAQKKIDEVL